MSMKPDDETLDPTLRRVVETLRAPVTGRRDLAARVLAEARRPAWRRGAAWITEPRAVRISPLAGLAIAAGLAGLLVLTRPAAPPAVAPAPPAPVVRFAIQAPGASTVALVGDFNDWDAQATLLQPAAGDDGLWTVEVPLAPGRHEYAFLVDGSEWRATAHAAPAADDFGRPNAVIHVTRRS